MLSPSCLRQRQFRYETTLLVDVASYRSYSGQAWLDDWKLICHIRNRCEVIQKTVFGCCETPTMSSSSSPPTPPPIEETLNSPSSNQPRPATAYHSVQFHDEQDEDPAIPTTPTPSASTSTPSSNKPLSVRDAMITLIKGNLGPGILNLPHAFALAGYGLGSVLFFVVSLQGLYSMWLLVSCQQRLQQQQNQQHNNTSLTFMGVARRVLGPYGGRAVEVFLLSLIHI